METHRKRTSPPRGRAPPERPGAARLRADGVEALPRLARGHALEPRLHDLPDGEDLLHRPTAERPPVDLRAHPGARHGALGLGLDPPPQHSLPALALRERPRSGRDLPGLRRGLHPAGVARHGELDIHDVAVDGRAGSSSRTPLFNCLATTDPDHSFRVLWKPPWISKLAPEDRCHLNGVAIRDGRRGTSRR